MTNGTSSATPLVHHGQAGAALRLGLVNSLLNVVTLLVWRFWGKTRVRRFLWSNTIVWGDPLEYTGRGGELFIGFLVVMALVYLPLVGGFSLAGWLTTQHNPVGGILTVGLQIVTGFLLGAGLYRARRYQLSRTRWRGIRAGQGGSAWEYGLMWLGIAIVGGLTLGWSVPWGEMRLARYRFAYTTFGTHTFTCTATAGPIYKRYAALWFATALYVAAAIAWATVVGVAASKGGDITAPSAAALVAMGAGALALAVPLLALPWAWYKVAFYRRLAEGTSFGAVRFAFEPGAWALLGLGFGNLLLTVFTLGIGRPWAAARTFRFVCQRLQVTGEPDFDAIRQSAEAAPRYGEGLATVLDGAGEF